MTLLSVYIVVFVDSLEIVRSDITAFLSVEIYFPVFNLKDFPTISGISNCVLAGILPTDLVRFESS